MPSKIMCISLVVLLSLSTHQISGYKGFHYGVNYRILPRNYLNRGLSGGFRFGVGYGISTNQLDTSKVWFQKFVNGSYKTIPNDEIFESVTMQKYEKAFCPDGELEECYSAIKGFVSYKSAPCFATGRYKIRYGSRSSQRFRVRVRHCGKPDKLGRYDWFDDPYWQGMSNAGKVWKDYFQPNSTGTYLSVREENVLNKGIVGGFRVRVGGESLDPSLLRVYKLDENDRLPVGMTLTTSLYPRTCYNSKEDPIQRSILVKRLQAVKNEEPTKGSDNENPTNNSDDEDPTNNSDHEDPTNNSDHEDPTNNSDNEDPTNNSDDEDPTNNSDNEDPTNTSDDEDPTNNSDDEDPTNNSDGEEPTNNSDDEDPTNNSDNEDPTNNSDNEDPTNDSDDEDPTNNSDDEDPTNDSDDEDPTNGSDDEDPTNGSDDEDPTNGSDNEDPTNNSDNEDPTHNSDDEDPTNDSDDEDPTNGSDEEDQSDSDSDDEDLVCKPALYSFVKVHNSDCSMSGTYAIEYNNHTVEFQVYVKPCGDADEYRHDYLYSDGEEDNL